MEEGSQNDSGATLLRPKEYRLLLTQTDQIPSKKWNDSLCNPVGKIDLPNPFQQNSPLFTLSPDLLRFILRCLRNVAPTVELKEGELVLTRPVFAFLETCKLLFSILSTEFHWFDVHGLISETVGHYVDRQNEHCYDLYGPCFTEVFVLYNDCTFLLIQRESPPTPVQAFDPDMPEGGMGGEPLPFVNRKEIRALALCPSATGIWELQNHCPSRLINTMLVPNKPKIIPSKRLNSNEMKVSEEYFLFQIDDDPLNLIPLREVILFEACGIPIENQIPGEFCCKHIVTNIFENLLRETGMQVEEIKKEKIIQKISEMCHSPPGMKENEIRIEIAKEMGKFISK